MTPNAEVHALLTELQDGRILATYSNYHLPWGVCAIVSHDEGVSWDLEHPVQLALSAGYYVGWPVTLELADGSLLTCYASTTYLEQPPERYTCEVVRWRPALKSMFIADHFLPSSHEMEMARPSRLSSKSTVSWAPSR